jgi:hypothetical protein
MQKRLRKTKAEAKNVTKACKVKKPKSMQNTNLKQNIVIIAGCHVSNPCTGLPRVRFMQVARAQFMLVATCTVHAGCHVYGSSRLPQAHFMQVATCTVHAGCHAYYFTVVHSGCRVLLPNLFPPPSLSQAHPLLLHRKQGRFL